jgi:hypothetical protein
MVLAPVQVNRRFVSKSVSLLFLMRLPAKPSVELYFKIANTNLKNMTTSLDSKKMATLLAVVWAAARPDSFGVIVGVGADAFVTAPESLIVIL